MKEEHIKKELFQFCEDFVSDKLENITTTIQSHKNALQSETKSSAGDKHETGRAMLQLEMEKAGQQLNQVQQMKLLLERINIVETTEIVRLGALVKTNFANYFIAVSTGKITCDKVIYYAISPNSPIGKILLGKHKGDEVLFQGRNLKIEEVL